MTQLRRFKFLYTHLVEEHDSIIIEAETHLEAENLFDNHPDLIGLDNVEVSAWSDLGAVPLEEDPNQLKMNFDNEIKAEDAISKTDED